jgi:tetratricopeptide (TPR) repeat protein
VGRHLANLPILARSPSTAYQLQKLVARHRGIVALGGVLAAALIVFAVAMSIMYGRQRAERLRAEHSSAFLRGMLASVDPANARGDQVLVRDILDEAAGKVATELAGEPILQAEVLDTLIEAYDGLGLPAEALSLARLRLDLVTRLAGAGSVERAAALRIFGGTHREAGHPDSALLALREADELTRRSARAPRIEVARTRHALAVALAAVGRLDEAEATHREALALLEKLEGKGSEYASYVSDLSTTLEQQGRNAEAEAAQREALAIHQRFSGVDHPDALVNMTNLALLLRKQRKYAEAESLYRATITLQRKVLGNEHPVLAKTLTNLGLAEVPATVAKS